MTVRYWILGSLVDDVSLRALDADGGQAWSADAGQLRNGAAHADGWTVVSHSSARRYEADGSGPVWSVVPGGAAGTTIAADGTILLAATAGVLQRLSPSGRILWSLDIGQPLSAASGTPDGGVVLARTDGAVERRDQDGALIWQASRTGAARAVAVDPGGAVVVAGDPASDGTHLVRHGPDGGFLWSAVCGSAVRVWSVAADRQGNIYAGAHRGGGGDGLVYKYSPDGDLLWVNAHPSPAQIRGLTVTADGHVLAAGGWGSAETGFLLDAADGRIVWTHDHGGWVASVLALPDPHRAAGGGAIDAGGSAAAVGHKQAAAQGAVSAGADALAGGFGRRTADAVRVTAGVSIDATGIADQLPAGPPQSIEGSGHLVAGSTASASGRSGPRSAPPLGVVGGSSGYASITSQRATRARSRAGASVAARTAVDRTFTTILPSSATHTMRALEQVTARASDLPALHRHNSDPGRVRAQLLPWQAWERAVDIWDHDWDDATRRAVSARALATHRIRGTPAAVESALASLGVDDAVLTEWFEDEPPRPPYTFRATVTRASGVGDALGRNLGRAIAAAKNTRSHMTRLTLIVPMTVTPLHAGLGGVAGLTVTVAPVWEPPGPVAGTACPAGATHSVATVTLAPDPDHDEDRHA